MTEEDYDKVINGHLDHINKVDETYSFSFLLFKVAAMMGITIIRLLWAILQGQRTTNAYLEEIELNTRTRS